MKRSVLGLAALVFLLGSAYGDENHVKPNLYVLAVADDKQAPNPHDFDDKAHRLKSIVTKHSVPLYQNVEVKMLLGPQATRKAILDGILWLQKTSTERDTVFCYIHAHGITLNGELAIWVGSNSNYEASKELSGKDLHVAISKVKGRSIIALDCCGSGGFWEKYHEKNPNLAVLCSCKTKETEGWFGDELLDGLSGKANRHGGVIHLYELENYIRAHQVKDSKGTEHPVFYIPKQMALLPLTKP